MKNLSFILIAALAVSACADSHTRAKKMSTEDAIARYKTLLVGTWSTPCETTNESTSSNGLTTILANGNYFTSNNNYDAANCEGNITSTYRASCTYEADINAQGEGTLSFDCPDASEGGVKAPPTQGSATLTITQDSGVTKMTTQLISASANLDGEEVELAEVTEPPTVSTKIN